MAEPLTKPHAGSVEQFIAAVSNERRRADARTIIALMRELTGCEPCMWGPSIIGFDSYRFVYESGREGDWPSAAFSPRATALTIYLNDGFGRERELLDRLGPHKTGRSCLYIKSLADVDEQVLRALIERSIAYVQGRYAPTATVQATQAPAKKVAKKKVAKKKVAKKKVAKKKVAKKR